MTPQRLLSLVLAASAPAIALAPTGAVAAATPQPPQAKRFKVAVQVEQGDAKLAAEAVTDDGAEARLSLGDDDHKHVLKLTVTELTDDKLQLKLHYRRDGKVVIKSKTVVATPGQPQKVRVRNTTLTFSLSQARPGHVRIDMPEGDDPLAGLP